MISRTFVRRNHYIPFVIDNTVKCPTRRVGVLKSPCTCPILCGIYTKAFNDRISFSNSEILTIISMCLVYHKNAVIASIIWRFWRVVFAYIQPVFRLNISVRFSFSSMRVPPKRYANSSPVNVIVASSLGAGQRK